MIIFIFSNSMSPFYQSFLNEGQTLGYEELCSSIPNAVVLQAPGKLPLTIYFINRKNISGSLEQNGLQQICSQIRSMVQSANSSFVVLDSSFLSTFSTILVATKLSFDRPCSLMLFEQDEAFGQALSKKIETIPVLFGKEGSNEIAHQVFLRMNLQKKKTLSNNVSL